MDNLTLAHGMMRNQVRPCGLTQDWITPKALLELLGDFDMDPCASMLQPWPTAKVMWNARDDGLKVDWRGRVWLNPPYDRFQILTWMQRMAAHRNGMAMVFARTDTKWFQTVWNAATAIYFFKGRVDFYTPQGVRATFNSGAPSCLIAYGEHDFAVLKELESNPQGWPGHCVRLVR